MIFTFQIEIMTQNTNRYVVTLEAVRGISFASDIAIDDITIYAGSCTRGLLVGGSIVHWYQELNSWYKNIILDIKNWFPVVCKWELLMSRIQFLTILEIKNSTLDISARYQEFDFWYQVSFEHKRMAKINSNFQRKS